MNHFFEGKEVVDWMGRVESLLQPRRLNQKARALVGSKPMSRSVLFQLTQL